MAPKKRPPIERFHSLTDRLENGCLVWTGWVGSNGYARHWVDGKNALAHRWSYEYHVGPIPEGLQIDHLCRNKACVNPEHLEAVTGAENLRRSRRDAVWRHNGPGTHCRRGHLKDEENTSVSGGKRSCKTCKRENGRRLYQADPEKHKAATVAWQKANPERTREINRETARRIREKKKAI